MGPHRRDGTVINTIDVPGLLINHKAHTVLTRALIVKEHDFE